MQLAGAFGMQLGGAISVRIGGAGAENIQPDNNFRGS